MIDFLASNSMNIMLSDKEGCFVIMPDGTFSEKATTAVLKNFRAVSDRPAKVKECTIKFLHQLNLTSVAAGAKKGKNLTLDVFFAAKTHKPGVPFRTIVSERDSWLQAISGYLQRHLDSLNIVDPMCVPNSKAVVDFLNVSTQTGAARSASMLKNCITPCHTTTSWLVSRSA